MLTTANIVNKTGYDSLDLKFTTGTAAAGAVTENSLAGQITTEALTTAAAGEYTLTITNSLITANSVVIASVGQGTSTAGTPGIGGVTPAAGSLVITVTNLHSANAFNGTLKINFAVIG
tara:strand:+ start:7023 stop:7379 length:357 start_codon:yes stop_codon:yes gene_type:complete